MWPCLDLLTGSSRLVVYDAVRNVVTNELIAANSGTKSQALVNPKGGVTLGPWTKTEFCANAGSGYHSCGMGRRGPMGPGLRAACVRPRAAMLARKVVVSPAAVKG